MKNVYKSISFKMFFRSKLATLSDVVPEETIDIESINKPHLDIEYSPDKKHVENNFDNACDVIAEEEIMKTVN